MGFRSVIEIGGRPVGAGHPCYVIAEAGSNHDGRLEQALALVDVAAAAGCDAVKFQIFRPEELMSPAGPRARYLDTLLGDRSLYELFTATAINRAWLPRIAYHCRTRGIHFLATPFDCDAVDRLVSPEVAAPAIKNASAELWHLPLVRHAARTGRPLLLSTGMATLPDVEDALVVAAAAGATDVALLQCTVSYPTPPESVNLRAIGTLAERFGVPVGFSDHTQGIWAPVAAVALGASVIEKHATLSRRLPGPDHPFAVEPDELAQMVRDIRATEQALGDGQKVRQPAEEEIYAIGRRNLVAVRDLAAGSRLVEADLAVLRSPLGIAPRDAALVAGRTLARPVAAGAPLTWNDLAPVEASGDAVHA
ncbi:MAG: N-acetylneuraminate synthase family protein [Candidatus Binatia bacterium]